MTSKKCLKCEQTKPLSDFYRHAQMADGHLNKCKDCACKDVRQHRLDNPEKVRAYDNKRAKLPHRREARRVYGESYAESEPEKRAAHHAVGRAIRDGKMDKKPCAFCGETDGLEAHHHDYAKPLDVTWMCRPCHRRFHALERMATYRKDAA